jgi:serine/threonine protein kinase/tetratricopeptide (TPR) repeat protein
VGEDDVALASDDLTGQSIAHYQIVRLLGRGGMGVVYAAEDARLRRPAALKVLAPRLAADRRALERFTREAQAASVLNHPNIATIYDVGEHRGGAYIAMELLEGATVADRLQSGPLAFATALKIADDVLDGLRAAHEAGIVHRDIKPANLFVTSRGMTKILDFGIAKDVGTADAATRLSAALTADGEALGTLGYMAPEQVRGEPVDGRVDLFAMGAVIYEMATGVRPFRGETPGVLVDAVLNRQPVPPSQLNPALPVALDAVVARCLAKHREDRYPDAASLQAALRSLRVSADPQPARDRARQRWTFIAAVGLAAGLVAAAAWLAVPRTPRLTERDRLVLADVDNQTGDPVFDDVLRQGLAIQLAQSPYLSLLPDRQIHQTLQRMQRPTETPLTLAVAREICERNGAAAVVSGAIARVGAAYVLGLRAEHCVSGEVIDDQQSRADSAEAVLVELSRMTALFRTRVGESLASVERHSRGLPDATTASIQALKAYAQGVQAAYGVSPAAAVPHFQRAIELDPGFAMAHASLGITYSGLGESTRASESTTRAYELRVRATDPERFFIAAMYDRQVTGNLERLLQTYEAWAATYPRDQVVHGLMSGFATHGTGQYERALAAARRAVELGPPNAISHVSLGNALLRLGRVGEAEEIVSSRPPEEEAFFADLRYRLAVVRADPAGMAAAVAAARGRDGVEDMLSHLQALESARTGLIADARRLSKSAVDQARQSGRAERAGLFAGAAALWEAWLGDPRAARQLAESALALSRGRDVQYAAALAMAIVRLDARARTLADDLAARFPEDTCTRFIYLPVLRAQLLLNEGRPEEAVAILEPGRRYDLATPGVPFYGFYAELMPVYVRGLALLAAGQWDAAARELAPMVQQPHLVVSDPAGALAQLARARALARAGDATEARAAYTALLEQVWRSADSGFAPADAARAELARLALP